MWAFGLKQVGHRLDDLVDVAVGGPSGGARAEVHGGVVVQGSGVGLGVRQAWGAGHGVMGLPGPRGGVGEFPLVIRVALVQLHHGGARGHFVVPPSWEWHSRLQRELSGTSLGPTSFSPSATKMSWLSGTSGTSVVWYVAWVLTPEEVPLVPGSPGDLGGQEH